MFGASNFAMQILERHHAMHPATAKVTEKYFQVIQRKVEKTNFEKRVDKVFQTRRARRNKKGRTDWFAPGIMLCREVCRQPSGATADRHKRNDANVTSETGRPRGRSCALTAVHGRVPGRWIRFRSGRNDGIGFVGFLGL